MIMWEAFLGIFVGVAITAFLFGITGVTIHTTEIEQAYEVCENKRGLVQIETAFINSKARCLNNEIILLD